MQIVTSIYHKFCHFFISIFVLKIALCTRDVQSLYHIFIYDLHNLLLIHK